jgi:hypothetical protein
MKWTRIDEREPERLKRVLLYPVDGALSASRVAIGFFGSYGAAFEIREGYNVHVPATHWAEIVPPDDD